MQLKEGTMDYQQLTEVLDAEVLIDGAEVPGEFCKVISSDLISDILMFIDENAILLTGLVNPQIIRVAEMIDIGAIVFVRGKEPEESLIERAREQEVSLAITDYTLYEASGKLYQRGLKSCQYGRSDDIN
ncbi:MAG: transcriptional regulator [Candidatus Bipolaricaulota bacterium]